MNSRNAVEKKKMSVRVTAQQVARMNALVEVEGEGKVNPQDRSAIFRECLEEGIERRMKKLTPAKRELVEKAGAAA